MKINSRFIGNRVRKMEIDRSLYLNIVELDFKILEVGKFGVIIRFRVRLKV